MSLTILTDDNVKDVLGNLTLEDVKIFQESLQRALHESSTGTQEEGACAMHQPERTSLLSPEGVTTLFMPSISLNGLGIKVVSLSTSNKAAKTTPSGALTLMNPQGIPYAFINASELTAFRTALTSSLLIARRQTPKTLLVFGSGKQAFWHLRLSLLIHGHSLEHIHIIACTLSPKAASLMKILHQIPHEIKAREGWVDVKIGMLSPDYNEYSRLIKERIRAADILFCTTPSTEPLFDHAILTSNEGRMKGRLIVAIGSYKPDMIEIPVEVIRQAVKENHKHHHHHKHAQEGGVVVVDTLSGCMIEAGEIIQSGISSYQLVELGELVMLDNETRSHCDDRTQKQEQNQEVASLSSDADDGGRTSMSSKRSSPDPGSSASISTLSTMMDDKSMMNGKSETPTASSKSSKKAKKNSTCANDEALCCVGG